MSINAKLEGDSKNRRMKLSKKATETWQKVSIVYRYLVLIQVSELLRVHFKMSTKSENSE